MANDFLSQDYVAHPIGENFGQTQVQDESILPPGVARNQYDLSKLRGAAVNQGFNQASGGKLGGLLSGTQSGLGQLSQLSSLAGKAGMLGKLGSIGTKLKGATPWGAGGLAVGALGDLISRKHAKTGGAISGMGKGAAMGATIGSIIPGVGTAIGGAVGGLIGGIKGLFGGKKKEKEKKAQQAAAAQNMLANVGSWKDRLAQAQNQTPYMAQYLPRLNQADLSPFGEGKQFDPQTMLQPPNPNPNIPSPLFNVGNGPGLASSGWGG